MTDWTAGYVSDIEYLPGFYREQCPSHLDLACLISGIEPPDRNEDFTYCELGCGVGVTSLVLAAANPTGRFFGIDFNPTHIARGRALGAEARLTNLELIEASFAELCEPDGPDLPQFDYVTMHGVYSWISQENRQAILRFLGRKVKPGGLVYVTYNAMPGWLKGVPLQRLLSDYARLQPGRSDLTLQRAIGFLHAMQAAGARHVIDADLVTRLQQDSDRGQSAYLVHEYLNEHWTPLYHADVAHDMAQAKLAFVGSAMLLENYPDLTLTTEQRQLLAGIPPGSVRETFKDYFLARSFRQDIFVRGPRGLSRIRQEERLRQLRLALIAAPDAIHYEIAAPIGGAKLEPRLYAPVCEALAAESRTLGELVTLPELLGKPAANAVELTGMLVGSGQALPVSADGGDAAAAVAFNKAMATHCARERSTSTAFAAAAAHSGVHANLFELLTYAGLAAGLPLDSGALAAGIWSDLSSRGDSLRRDGQLVEGEQVNMAVLREETGRVLASVVPMWRRIGVL